MITTKVFTNSFARRLILMTWLCWGLFSLFIFIQPREYQDMGCHFGNRQINPYFFMIVSIIVYIHVIVLIVLQMSTFKTMRKYFAQLQQHGLIPTRTPLVINVMSRSTKVATAQSDVNKPQGHPVMIEPQPGCSRNIKEEDPTMDGSSLSDALSKETSLSVEERAQRKTSSKMNQALRVTDLFSSIKKNKIRSEAAKAKQNENKLYKAWIKRVSLLIKKISIMLILFLVCYIPFFVVVPIQIFNDNFPANIIPTAAIFYLLNSLTNIIVYATTSDDYRNAFKSIFTCRN
ncbi:unnamed protein product [Owenia fusiformis]|uniref:Uncharacterized protein n=1 Tax=Owenia fusiformis TaxID=6347 RepID=A0A8J1TTQ0_OWEFU|nr:unnamed protein product [Owenia fusiformis]